MNRGEDSQAPWQRGEIRAHQGPHTLHQLRHTSRLCALCKASKIDPSHNLHYTRGVSRRGLTEGRRREVRRRRWIVRESGVEVLQVKGIKHLGPNLELDFLTNPRLLRDAQVHQRESRAVDHVSAAAAVAVERLDARRAVGRGDIASGRSSQSAISVSTGRAYAESANCIIDNVLRQEVHNPVRIVKSDLQSLLKIFARHSDQSYITHIQRVSALNARGSVKLPTADDSVHDTTGVTKQPFAPSNRQFVYPVCFEHVRNVSGCRETVARGRCRD